MNVKNILRLADFIEQDALEDTKFNMRMMGRKTDCGTIACIAGYGQALFNPEEWHKYLNNGVFFITPAEGCADALELDREYALHELFAPFDIFYFAVTPQIAAQVLRNLAQTGEVVWPNEVKVPL